MDLQGQGMKIELTLDDSCLPDDGHRTLPALVDALRDDPIWFINSADTLRITSPLFGSYSEER